MSIRPLLPNYQYSFSLSVHQQGLLHLLLDSVHSNQLLLIRWSRAHLHLFHLHQLSSSLDVRTSRENLSSSVVTSADWFTAIAVTTDETEKKYEL